jgi:hypothetical protein
MKQRPPKLFVRETGSLKPSGRRPESRIKAVRHDAPSPQPAPKQLTWAEYIERQIEITCYRLRGTNDEEVRKDADEAKVFRDELMRSSASAMVGRTNYGEETLTFTAREKGGNPLSRLSLRFLSKLPLIRPKPGDYKAPRSVPEALKKLKGG